MSFPGPWAESGGLALEFCNSGDARGFATGVPPPPKHLSKGRPSGRSREGVGSKRTTTKGAEGGQASAWDRKLKWVSEQKQNSLERFLFHIGMALHRNAPEPPQLGDGRFKHALIGIDGKKQKTKVFAGGSLGVFFGGA